MHLRLTLWAFLLKLQLDIGITHGIVIVMNAKHKKTLASIFASPTPRTLSFRDIESLLRAVGCIVEERPGSAVGFIKGECSVGFHRPHPRKEAKPYQVKDAREFLRRIGVEP